MFLDEKGKAAYDSGVESFNRGMDKLHEESAGYYKDVAEQNTGAALEEDWFGRWNNGRWLVNAGKFLAIQARSRRFRSARLTIWDPSASPWRSAAVPESTSITI